MSSSFLKDEKGSRLGSNALPPLSSSGKAKKLSQLEKEKAQRIQAACDEQKIKTLQELAATEGGLVQDELRRLAWPLLLGYDASDHSQKDEWRHLSKHRDEDQVQLDVNRSFVYYPTHESDSRKDARKRELSDLITAVLRCHPFLCYFQGYHDIIQVLLLVLGADAAEPAVARLSLLRIRDFMLPTLAGAESHLHLLPAILYAVDIQVYKHLVGATQPTPFFALAATLTLYAHDIEEYGDIARLFDFLLASEAAVPVYLFAVIVISRREELLEIEPEEPEMLHSILSKLPKPLDLEGLIQRTRTLFNSYPPDRLPNRAWNRISPSSVLKTTRDTDAFAAQTLEYGRLQFEKQASEIRRQEARKQFRLRTLALVARYKRPAAWTGTAVVAALLAMYLSRYGLLEFTPDSTALFNVQSYKKGLQLLQGLFNR